MQTQSLAVHIHSLALKLNNLIKVYYLGIVVWHILLSEIFILMISLLLISFKLILLNRSVLNNNGQAFGIIYNFKFSFTCLLITIFLL